jgi:hypothetical protein
MAKQNLRNQMIPRRRPVPNPIRQVMHLIRTATAQVKGPSDPPGVDQDVVITKKTELTISVPLGSSPQNVLISDIAGTIPGGTTAFPGFRIQKVSIWGPSVVAANNDGRIAVSFPENATFPGNDFATFSDYGTAGQARAQLHISPTVATRQQWNATGNTSVMPFMVLESSATGANNFVIQFTLELRSQSVIF